MSQRLDSARIRPARDRQPQTPGAKVARGARSDPAPLEAACACGGGCPRCAGEVRVVQARARSGGTADPYEARADHVAEEIVRGGRVTRGLALAGLPPPGGRGALDGEIARATGGGRALEPGVRAPLERAVGLPLDHVRVHDDARAASFADRLDARAFTYGRDIFFGAGELAPHTGAGHRLLAHEIAHVLQQAAIGAAPGVQRQPRVDPSRSHTFEPGTTPERNRLARQVDAAVRAHFNLTGRRLRPAQVDFVTAAVFAQRFPTSSQFARLFPLFLAFGQNHTSKFYHILDYNNEVYFRAATSSTISSLRRFVEAGIQAGSFTGQTRETEVRTGRRFPPFTITPGELIAEFVGGFTDFGSARSVAGQRRGTHIVIQESTTIPLLVHEVCHFYAHPRFVAFVEGRPDKGDELDDTGVQVGEVLYEGIAETCAREVVDANPAFGRYEGTYHAEVEQLQRIMVTMGRSALHDAYFRGDRRQLVRLGRIVDAYARTHPDLLVPRVF